MNAEAVASGRSVAPQTPGAVDDDFALLTRQGTLLQRVRVNHTGIRVAKGFRRAQLFGIVVWVGVKAYGFGQSIPLGITQPILLQQTAARPRDGRTATADETSGQVSY